MVVDARHDDLPSEPCVPGQRRRHEHARLGREVVVAGVYDHLEIWDRATWREHLKQVEGSAQHVAERLAAKRD